MKKAIFLFICSVFITSAAVSQRVYNNHGRYMGRVHENKYYGGRGSLMGTLENDRLYDAAGVFLGSIIDNYLHDSNYFPGLVKYRTTLFVARA